ncbi:MAG: carbonic anhydrase [Gemmatimonadaceae bacterium]|nr:carbonic anhydrase [Gemmatimonadaceae bacterium]
MLLPSLETLTSRRTLLKTAVAAAALTAPGTLLAADAEARLYPEVQTPDEAIQRLVQGNQRFVAGNIQAPNRNMARLKEVAGGQKPFAAFLGCADSRVPIEIVFDQGFGDLFVTRIAGNVADPAIIGSLEFGTLVLGAKVLCVLGHSKCGAVDATIKGQEVPGQISTLYQHIRRAAKEAKGDLDAAVARNVQVQVEILQEASPVLAARIRSGALKVVGGVYDLESGLVRFL